MGLFQKPARLVSLLFFPIDSIVKPVKRNFASRSGRRSDLRVSIDFRTRGTIQMPSQATYRKQRSSTLWHFCMNCKDWPSKDFDEISSAANAIGSALRRMRGVGKKQKMPKFRRNRALALTCSFSCLISRRTHRAKTRDCPVIADPRIPAPETL